MTRIAPSQCHINNKPLKPSRTLLVFGAHREGSFYEVDVSTRMLGKAEETVLCAIGCDTAIKIKQWDDVIEIQTLSIDVQCSLETAVSGNCWRSVDLETGISAIQNVLDAAMSTLRDNKAFCEEAENALELLKGIAEENEG